MDVTETPIERPKRRQKWYYSGKKKRHTLKTQIVIDRLTRKIICTNFGHGKQHDERCSYFYTGNPFSINYVSSQITYRYRRVPCIKMNFLFNFALFKASGIRFHPSTESLQDSGYQGIDEYHCNSFIPQKKPKNGKLSANEKEYNRELAKERIGIEHVNRHLKIFKVFSERYRNRRKRYGLRCNLLAAIYNYELDLAS